MSHATRGEYTITTGSHAQDLEAIHGFLTNSYWSPGVPIEVVERAIANSLCFGLFRGKDQVGFAWPMSMFLNLIAGKGFPSGCSR